MYTLSLKYTGLDSILFISSMPCLPVSYLALTGAQLSLCLSLFCLSLSACLSSFSFHNLFSPLWPIWSFLFLVLSKFYLFSLHLQPSLTPLSNSFAIWVLLLLKKTSSRKSRNPSSAGDCFVANLVARSKKTKTGFFGSKKMMPKNITCWNFFCWNATFDWKRFRCSTFLFSFSSVRACRKCSWYLIFEQF